MVCLCIQVSKTYFWSLLAALCVSVCTYWIVRFVSKFLQITVHTRAWKLSHKNSAISPVQNVYFFVALSLPCSACDAYFKRNNNNKKNSIPQQFLLRSIERIEQQQQHNSLSFSVQNTNTCLRYFILFCAKAEIVVCIGPIRLLCNLYLLYDDVFQRHWKIKIIYDLRSLHIFISFAQIHFKLFSFVWLLYCWLGLVQFSVGLDGVYLKKQQQKQHIQLFENNNNNNY